MSLYLSPTLLEDQLVSGMSLPSEITNHLNEVSHRVDLDLGIYSKYPEGGGTLSVLLGVFSLVNYLAGLHKGKSDPDSADSANFIKEFFPNKYHSIPGVLYYTLRHGTVHERLPKQILFSDGKEFGFIIDPRIDKKSLHLKPLQFEPKEYNGIALIINTHQLLDDFRQSIENFRSYLRSDQKHQGVFLKGYVDYMKCASESYVQARREVSSSELGNLKTLLSNPLGMDDFI